MEMEKDALRKDQEIVQDVKRKATKDLHKLHQEFQVMRCEKLRLALWPLFHHILHMWNGRISKVGCHIGCLIINNLGWGQSYRHCATKLKYKQDMKVQTTLEIRLVIEYSSFFYGEKPIDINEALKRFKRDDLVKIATLLSLHYGNMSFPDDQNTLFSESSKKHIPYLNGLFDAYYKRLRLHQGQKVELLTYRTGLELWRRIFAIRADEFTAEVEDEDVELTIFKIIISINEKIVNFMEKKSQYQLDELLFLNNFLTNDSNNYELQSVLQPQMFYFQKLIDFIPSNEVMSKASEVLLGKFGIDSWRQYFTTIIGIALKTDGYITRKGEGVPIITPQWIEQNKKFLSLSLIEHLCIDEDMYIPYDDDEAIKKELNVDYRVFRSKPFVKLKGGTGYVVINNQLLCERLFNSLYFDFNPLINGKKGSCGLFDYNKDFIEKVLFRKTFFNCLPSNSFTFPARGDKSVSEKPNEPDFYVRTKNGCLIIVECKAVKMNGECRDDGDYSRLLDELHEKIVRKTRNLDPMRKEHKGAPEPLGVGQLINHIDSIEADTFQWDKEIPDDVRYYPILVFEDVKLVQKGVLSLVNRWFYEDVEKEWEELDMSVMACAPVMVVSINTLFLYDKFLLKRGLTNVIDEFVEKNAVCDHKSGEYKLSVMADFDEYLRKNRFNKKSDIMKWYKQFFYGLGTAKK